MDPPRPSEPSRDAGAGPRMQALREVTQRLVDVFAYLEQQSRQPSAPELDAVLAAFAALCGLGRESVGLANASGAGARGMWVVDCEPDALAVSELLGPKIGASAAQRLTRAFTSRKLCALTLFAGIDAAELGELLSWVARQNATSMPALPHARVLFEHELVTAQRPLAWRTRLGLSMLQKDLHDAADTVAARAALLARAVRAMRGPDAIAELGCHVDLLALPGLDAAFLDAMPQELFAPTLEVLCRTRSAADRSARGHGTSEPPHTDPPPPSGGRGPVSANSEGLGARRLVALGLTRLGREGGRESLDELERLLRASLVKVEELPSSIHARLERRNKARKLATEAPERALRMRRGEARLATELDDLRELTTDFVHLAEWRALAELALALDAASKTPQTPGRQRVACVEALQRAAREGLLTALVAHVSDRGVERSRRAEAAVLAASLGATSTLVEAVRDSDDRVLRDVVGEALRSSGDAELAALRWLGRPDAVLRTRENMLALLEYVGTGRALTAVQFLLRDTDPKLRASAATSYARVAGKAAEVELVALLGDPKEEVRAAAVYALAELGNRSPDLVHTCLEALDPGEPRACGERLRLAAVSAIVRLGNARLTKDTDCEQLLCEALLGSARTLLAFALPRRMPFGSAVSEAICEGLGQIGNERALRALRLIAERERGRIADHARRALAAIELRQKPK